MWAFVNSGMCSGINNGKYSGCGYDERSAVVLKSVWMIGTVNWESSGEMVGITSTAFVCLFAWIWCKDKSKRVPKRLKVACPYLMLTPSLNDHSSYGSSFTLKSSEGLWYDRVITNGTCAVLHCNCLCVWVWCVHAFVSALFYVTLYHPMYSQNRI